MSAARIDLLAEATMINRKLGADKVAADALEREALRARMSVIDAKEEAREVRTDNRDA